MVRICCTVAGSLMAIGVGKEASEALRACDKVRLNPKRSIAVP